MADKTIGELPPLPGLYDDALIPVEQQGTAHRMSGRQFREFGEKAAEAAGAAVVQRVTAIAATVETNADQAAQSEKNAKTSAEQAAQNEQNAKTNADKAAQSENNAKTSANNAAQSVTAAKSHADKAAAYRDKAGDHAALSRSWAVGRTGVRPGEDTDNAQHYAAMARAEAERAAVPAVTGVYNIILQDRVTGRRYALIVRDERLALLEVGAALDALEMALVDTGNGKAYALTVIDGHLTLEETGTQEPSHTSNGLGSGVYNIVLVDEDTEERYALIVEGCVLKLLGVSGGVPAMSPTLIDNATGTAYKIRLKSKRIILEEV